MALPSLEPAVVCAENIALLHALHTVPLQPAKNNVDDELRFKWKDGYILSFEQERKLTSALSFLCSISDNPDHVAAVCIEEDHTSPSLRVLVAINKRGQDDGRPVLQRLKTGLEGVLEPLSRFGRPPSEVGDSLNSVEGDVFTAIVSTCQKRILCRLRLVPNTRNKPKQAFKSTLQQAVNSLKRRCVHEGGSVNLTAAQTSLIIEAARAVMKLLDAWHQYQVPARLEQLVFGVHQLHGTLGLYNTINKIPNSDMEPTARSNLLNITQKVARYYKVAKFLYRMAKTVPVIRQTSVTTVNLPPTAFHRALPGKDYVPDMSSKIEQVYSPAKLTRQEVNRIFRCLQTDRDAPTGRFQSLARKTLQDAKIHAEIQLLFYIEQKQTSPSEIHPYFPPRVVRSNKDACFLCNSFIKMHGKIYTSRHHGKLYPGWRLPATVNVEVQKRFNTVLADQIKSSLVTLQKRQRKTEYPGPNESTLTTLPSLTSIVTVAVRHHDETETPKSVDMAHEVGKPLVAEVAVEGIVSDTTSKASSHTLPHQSSVVDQDAEPPASAKDTAADIESPPVRPTLSIQDSTLTDGANGPQSDIPGENILHAVLEGTLSPDSVEGGTMSQLHVILPFEIRFEYDGLSVPCGGTEPKKLRYRLEKLTEKEAKLLLSNQSSAIFDMEKIRAGDEVSFPVGSLDCFHVAARNSTLKVSFTFL
ncbi:uncharacterized protein SPSK_03147 [Sporothrix schenckii 1099-18]|uniref:Uncharacterized protein n=1 Tax=Sporothrix schenckii 1099-18 TaxID=1397361 RepID=A0A0F2M1C3_SPOSC|nr:uncharacterized protein SPSK_03147 [Sporothrix schenckii 1099-18]KJR81941.1 hypothetical protein SPSK_03147 [Sporothrix schenckii 1099-18]